MRSKGTNINLTHLLNFKNQISKNLILFKLDQNCYLNVEIYKNNNKYL